ncbi:MAG: hypothetical protein A3F70_08625 [Acidobacteria bacterium RIFCSPLOWO2_12_FULL_67_14]|nr:MAG: hypothetical protein A3H29_10885 [Acidobacteria bacterium RIFCSPLOWO2_02_FULL_67_21]OFW41590.1 MAG: hypothetical protein A3F70_08625 [Acidobacteria bacterium RIFCSPLOWO2_12_FULL_67_14]
MTGAMTEHNDDDTAREHPERWYAEKEFLLLLHRLRHLPPSERAYLQGQFTLDLVNEPCVVDTSIGPLSFVLLGRASAGRAMSLLTKQPATIHWIDAFQPESVFWDVGANVGAYTVYAARRGAKVVAIEPAAVNLFLLAANCEANRVDDRVQCLMLGLGNVTGVAQLDVSQLMPAASFKFKGKGAQPLPTHQAALTISMDRLIEEYGVACPHYIKIDAPGFTEDIITGGARTLQRPDVRELHIELREASKRGRRIADLLHGHGFEITGRDSHGGSTDVTFARSTTR